ncbi:MAG: alpha-L-rhamnosidase [Phycisphaerae bacterium]|nr:alpha-L-rhamnosidase [Phycisphaerae bacterium]
MTRVFLPSHPFADLSDLAARECGDWPWAPNNRWTAKWVDHPGRGCGDWPSVVVFRLVVDVPPTALAERVRVHVTADQRYRLMLDGRTIGRGPERGDVRRWRFESYELELPAGRHVLLAQSWWLADRGPLVQTTLRPGFLLQAEGAWHELLSTGVASWESMRLDGYGLVDPGHTLYSGSKTAIDGRRFPWGWQGGDGPYVPVETIRWADGVSTLRSTNHFWLLTPATLPPMLDQPWQGGSARYVTDAEDTYPVSAEKHLPSEAVHWQRWLDGDGSVTIPPRSRRRAIIDLEDYLCAYASITLSGGADARLAIRWAEALFEQPTWYTAKGNRAVIDGKHFLGYGDEYIADGGAARTFEPLWWNAGRYLEIDVATADEPLTLDALHLSQTRYPMEMECSFAASDERFAEVVPLAERTLKACFHETIMDCPYYEQMPWVGDSRVDALVGYVFAHDDRLARKAIETYNASRLWTGLTQSWYPANALNMIPSFALWWVCMVEDFFQWRESGEFARRMLLGARTTMEAFRSLTGRDGMITLPHGSNFIDWVRHPAWAGSGPRVGEEGYSSILNLIYVLALNAKSRMEAFYGDPLMATRDRQAAEAAMAGVMKHFWNEPRSLLADTLEADSFSEHAQSLAILTGLLPADRQERIVQGLLSESDLARTTIFFSHYLLDALGRAGRTDAIVERLGLWFGLKGNGFLTTYEHPEPTRSDCHAWGTHPLYHFLVTILGVRPASPGFGTVRIEPQLGPLTWAHGRVPHQAGLIEVRVTRTDGDGFEADITLPPGLSGVFVQSGKEIPMQSGRQMVK